MMFLKALTLFLFAFFLSCATANGFAPSPLTSSRALQIPSQHPPHQQPPFSSTPKNVPSTRLHAFAPVDMLLTLRGGAAAQAALNMGRESYKLQSMATYSTITALIMNASLRLYTSQKFAKTKDDDKPRTRYIEHLFVALTTVCIICGAFTAVMFNILGIYSKECLGGQNDVGYVAFQTATAIYRKYGFRCFLATCLSFVGSFLLTVHEKAQFGRSSFLRSRGRWIFYLSVILALLGCYHIKVVLNLATQFIYTPEYKIMNHIA